MTSYRQQVRNYRRICSYCGSPTLDGAWLCPDHETAATQQYANENPTVIAAYANAGIAEIENLHRLHADFHTYLEQHPSLG